MVLIGLLHNLGDYSHLLLLGILPDFNIGHFILVLLLEKVCDMFVVVKMM